MENIAVIGIGALGKRHLQSLMNLKDDYSIYAVEVNKEVIQRLKDEMPEAHFCTSITELPEFISAAVIATNSNIRRLVFEQLISHCNISNILFEKVLFQREEDYYSVQEKIRDYGINAWVNCARREWDSYKDLKIELEICKKMYFYAAGGQWGIGCNGIHMLDLIEFLSDSKIKELNIDKLEKGVFESKRKGFYEFFGTISGGSEKCKDFRISCIQDSSLPFNIEIDTNSARYIIDEGHNSLFTASEKSGWKWMKREFLPLYQSQMTERVIKNILDKGTCNLPDYESSMELHLKFIKPLVRFFNMNGMEGNVCPIT